MDKFDEYKFFAESTNSLSKTRQASHQLYLTTNIIIIATLIILIKDLTINDECFFIFAFPLFLAGFLACWIWYKSIMQYKRLINWRYDQLNGDGKSNRKMPSNVY